MLLAINLHWSNQDWEVGGSKKVVKVSGPPNLFQPQCFHFYLSYLLDFSVNCWLKKEFPQTVKNHDQV